MDLEHLQAIRVEELHSVILAIKAEKGSHGNLLEIGAGSGWQARELAACGYAVFAVDIPGSRYDAHRIWPVILYDGCRLPFKDASFDIVFSSNVLEHIADISSFEKEIHRVLKDDGIAAHVLPTSIWRVWTSLTHHIHLFTWLIRIFRSRIRASENHDEIDRAMQKYSKRQLLFLALWPHRHGEYGNSLSEIFRFRSNTWIRHFSDTGWKVVQRIPTRIFYTGNSILGKNLTIKDRKHIARLLGSSSSIFLLKKGGH